MPARSRRPPDRTPASTPSQSPQQDQGGLLERGNAFLNGLLGRGAADPEKVAEVRDRAALLRDAWRQSASQRDPKLVERHEKAGERLDRAEALLGRPELDRRGLDAANEHVGRADDDLAHVVARSGTVLDVAPTEGPAGPGEFDTIFVNGAGAGLAESMQQARGLADVRGTDVSLVHNESEGVPKDFAETLRQGEGLERGRASTRESATLAKTMEERLAAGRNVDVVGHSQGAMFGGEALVRMGDGRSEEERAALNDRVHLTGLGAALNDKQGELAPWFSNATFIDEREDWVLNTVGGRGRPERDGFDGLVDDSADHREGIEHLVFDDPRHEGVLGRSAGAHDTSVYFGHEAVAEELRSSPFARGRS